MLNFIISIIVVFSYQQPKLAEQVIKDKLIESAHCWNKGDFECFMQTYWKSDSLKFIGGSGITYGWTNTLERYKVGYPTAKERGVLTFNNLMVEVLGKDYCFMIGEWHIQRDTKDIGGHFTLLWKKINGEWLITTDHSS